MTAPARLHADNFTPATRTPWGGTRILSHYKAGLDVSSEGVVGESWEVSVEPSFPSRVEGGGTLAEHIATDPERWLGGQDARRYGQCPLLVKLLDAADNLSVQVHPSDEDPALASDESGKPESWVVLDAAPGAGIYLGFREGVDRVAVRACLDSGGALDELMTFVPVQAGDAFVIEAGTPHAIGSGVTLLEPQHVTPGRRGLTYRFWDWNRRYNAHGERDDDGKPRELHIERSLAVTRWDAPRGDAFVATCRAQKRHIHAHLDRVVDWRWLAVDRWHGTGTFSVETDRLLALTCVGGAANIKTSSGALRLECGQSGVIPAEATDVEVAADSLTLFATTTASQRQ